MDGEEAADSEISSAATATAPAGKTPLPELIPTPGSGGSEPKAWQALLFAPRRAAPEGRTEYPFRSEIAHLAKVGIGAHIGGYARGFLPTHSFSCPLGRPRLWPNA